MSAFPILVIGAGRMGLRIAAMLAQDARFAARIITPDDDALAQVARLGLGVAPASGNGFRADLQRHMAQARAVILTDALVPAAEVARLAADCGCHYLDILEDAAASAAVAALVATLPGDTTLCFASGCGLAPGHVTGLAAEALASVGQEAEVTVFVGVLPAHPTNRLGYANIWSIDSLIGEYTAPCVAIRSGVVAFLPPLTEAETLNLGGETYEAFTTAGSLDALARQYAGRVGALEFKTLRYPGHLDYLQFLLDDMGLSKRLYQLRSLLKTALPQTEDDRVLIALRIRPSPDAPEVWIRQFLQASTHAGQCQSAIGTATAAHVCAVADLICGEKLLVAGFIAPGTIGPAHLRASPFFDLLDPGKPSFEAA
ncbi:saccharopine dehydrogenase family protein [Cypionkella sp.]|jgi:saccharopine dehydrogenase-like NADP-dependent oxidoreductase|uniref:saccharopine dehydrogenase family protein n=1 Tax=Cypionkella sp. TaxID=2811411 RepID=UPI0027181DAA|nr:saccharopine dehydrogenase C-terminal domain-containing protein [Cypionkella sp.]MDO8986581.1 saccharopine dehydrogenase C-terminal domain-containing protein [Cypionkella sp.]MDP2050770.1 saccharopine dehydrogenase C-terminal domain-containing protein [Cypionkella sp.]